MPSRAFREPQCDTKGTVAFDTTDEEPVAEALEATPSYFRRSMFVLPSQKHPHLENNLQQLTNHLRTCYEHVTNKTPTFSPLTFQNVLILLKQCQRMSIPLNTFICFQISAFLPNWF